MACLAAFAVEEEPVICYTADVGSVFCSVTH